MPLEPEHRSLLRFILRVVAVVLLLCAWYIALGNNVFDSTNAGAFGYFALALFAASFLP